MSTQPKRFESFNYFLSGNSAPVAEEHGTHGKISHRVPFGIHAGWVGSRQPNRP